MPVPSFLIVHCASQDGRIDAYRQPPTLDIGGLRVPLDWGDTTLHVPAGDLPVTVFVTRTSGQVEGAKITVRSPAGTGTRLTFVPPMQPGGASEHFNAESGETWLRRAVDTWPKTIWLNPTPKAQWRYTPSTQMIQQLFSDRMYALTLEGIDAAMRELVR